MLVRPLKTLRVFLGVPWGLQMNLYPGIFAVPDEPIGRVVSFRPLKKEQLWNVRSSSHGGLQVRQGASGEPSFLDFGVPGG